MEPPTIKDHKKPRVKHHLGKNESVVDMFGSIQKEGFQVLQKSREEKIKVSTSVNASRSHRNTPKEVEEEELTGMETNPILQKFNT